MRRLSTLVNTEVKSSYDVFLTQIYRSRIQIDSKSYMNLISNFT